MGNKPIFTKEIMEGLGFSAYNNSGYMYEKPIPNLNPLNNEDGDTGIKIVVHSLYNAPTFAILFPDGGLLNFVVDSIQQLEEFEKRISFYDPPF